MSRYSTGTVLSSRRTQVWPSGNYIIMYAIRDHYTGEIFNLGAGLLEPCWPEPIRVGGTCYMAITDMPDIGYFLRWAVMRPARLELDLDAVRRQEVPAS